jgi:FOG: PKD repeat
VTGWQWNFGDGSANETGQSTMHNFPLSGTYTVTLTVTDGINNSSATVGITVDQSLLAGFALNMTNSSSMLGVQFYDTSVGSPAGWEWNFGDGTANVTEPNPYHTFPSAGIYTVTLTVTNDTQSNVVSQPIEVSSDPAPTLSTDPSATTIPDFPAFLLVLTLAAVAGLVLFAWHTRRK